ncbi:MAG TPA: hypothetical protein VG934_01270 [Candidatus Paceibacterota bacterium]|nr:hypothetical protein [Candidatus Paceibacterota bacterium]
MAYEDKPALQAPEAGYYYHYKHDPMGAVNNYAYYIYGAGHHTEDDCRPEDANMQVYKPLYDAFVYKNGKMFDLRPLHMFWEKAQWQGKVVDRFIRITDPKVIEQLQDIRKSMYKEELEDWGL